VLGDDGAETVENLADGLMDPVLAGIAAEQEIRCRSPSFAEASRGGIRTAR
jgi:hypothetical protein